MYYFIFNLRHLEYSSQYVLMQRFILILFPKCLTLPAAPLCSLFPYFCLKQNSLKSCLYWETSFSLLLFFSSISLWQLAVRSHLSTETPPFRVTSEICLLISSLHAVDLPVSCALLIPASFDNTFTSTTSYLTGHSSLSLSSFLLMILMLSVDRP